MKTLTKNAVKISPIPTQEVSGPVVRIHETWTCGDVAFQGDLIFICIGSMLPSSAKTRKNRQLADGNTQGSRHVLDGGECFDADKAEISKLIRLATKGKVPVDQKYIGPIFTGDSFVRHPQHQDQGFPADTVTACVFQRNLDAEEREVRARD